MPDIARTAADPALPSTGSLPDGAVPVARASQLRDGEPLVVKVEGLELLVLAHGGEVRVFQGTCPHQGTSLSTATCAGGTVTCSAHEWRFDCATGARLGAAGPGLRAFAAELRGDVVCVSRQELESWRESSRPSRTPVRLRDVEDLAGPRGLPLLGNALALQPARLHDILDEWADRYGRVYVFRIGRRPVVAVSDARLVNHALRERPDGYRRWSVLERVADELSVHGVFSAEGADWRRQRPLAAHALDVAHVGSFFDRLGTIIRRLHRRWEASAGSGTPLEIQKDLMRFTVDVTTALALGHDLNTLETGGDVIQQHLERIFPVLLRRINAVFPWWRYVKLPSDRAVDRAVEAVRAATAATIAAARERVRLRASNGTAKPADFMEALVSARDPAGAPLTDREIFANVLTMLLAGEDTTANTIAWMAHLLARHPEAQMRARAEVDEVLGEERFLTRFADAGRMPYLDAVLNETMRLKPVAPMLFVETCRDEILGDLRLPRGTRLALLTRRCALQEENFSDPYRFDPGRWLREDGRASHHREAFMPFGGGPRYCPGRHLATLEGKGVAAMLLRNYRIEHVEGRKPVRERFCFTMMPENLLVRLEAR